MQPPYRLGKLFGLAILVRRLTIFASGSLWVAFSLVAHFFLEQEWTAAALSGLAGVLVHYLAVTVHQLGHAAAARRTGYPMHAVLVSGFLGLSIYPRNEPDLPPEIHIRRALGGPAASFLLALLAGLVALALPTESVAARLLGLLSLDSLLIFTIGALLPLGFTDGSTLLRNRKSR